MSSNASNHERANIGSFSDEEKAVEHPQDRTAVVVPEGGLHGWLCVAGLFLFNMATWASNSAYAVYLAHYLEYDTFENATKIDYAAIGGLAFGAGIAIAPVVRFITRTFGFRITVILGAVCQLLGILLAAFATKLWQLYLTQGMLMGFGLALITMPGMTVIPQWFRKKRSLAMAISAAGSGVGGIIFNLAIQRIVNEYGLKWAFITEAIVCLACVVIGLALIRTRESEIKMVMALWDWNILTYGCYWLFAGFIILTLFGYVVMLYNLTDFTISLGYSAYQGSIVSAMISVGIIFGRPTIGFLADKHGTVTVSVFIQLFVAVLCFAMWIPARNYATALAFAIMEGATMGTLWVVLAPISVRLFGLRKLDVCLAMTWIIIGACGVVSPIIGIELRGATPSDGVADPTVYLHPAIWCGAVYLASAIMLWFTRAYLIARDIEAEKLGDSNEDMDELYLSVHWTAWLKSLFALSPVRKV